MNMYLPQEKNYWEILWCFVTGKYSNLLRNRCTLVRFPSKIPPQWRTTLACSNTNLVRLTFFWDMEIVQIPRQITVVSLPANYDTVTAFYLPYPIFSNLLLNMCLRCNAQLNPIKNFSSTNQGSRRTRRSNTMDLRRFETKRRLENVAKFQFDCVRR